MECTYGSYMIELDFDSLQYPLPERKPTVACPVCGRFAKYLREGRVTMGEYNEWWVRVLCGKCGEQYLY